MVLIPRIIHPGRPPYPAPPPLTVWPAYPPPNWDYNTNSPYNPDQPPPPIPDPDIPTNYPDIDPAYTNGGVSYSLAQWYSMFRDVLRDSGNEVDFAVPAQYQFVWSNTVAPALDMANEFVSIGNQTVTNIHAVVEGVVVKISELSVSLPTYFETQTEIDLGEIPYFGQVVIDLTLFSTPINLFRNICKYGLYLISVLLAMHMIRKAFSRGGD